MKKSKSKRHKLSNGDKKKSLKTQKNIMAATVSTQNSNANANGGASNHDPGGGGGGGPTKLSSSVEEHQFVDDFVSRLLQDDINDITSSIFSQ